MDIPHISARLRAIADCVSTASVCDIGTDHAYLPVLLAQQGKLSRAAACDINAGPLVRAKANIAAHSLCSIIETRHGDGLSCVRHGEFDTCVIAGMGGMLITEILSKHIDKAWSFKQIILSPQSDVYAVRRFLHKNNFKIDNELLIYEGNKWYNIIECSKGADVPYSEPDYLFGKILLDRRCPALISFLDSETAKTERILHNLDPSRQQTRISELNSYLDICNEARSFHKPSK